MAWFRPDLTIQPAERLPSGNDIQPVDLSDLDDLVKLCQAMEQLCTKADGLGLSAVQLGMPIKLFIVRKVLHSVFTTANGRYGWFVNTEYTGNGKTVWSTEGCLSLIDPTGKHRLFTVPRHSGVRVAGQMLDLTKSVQDVNLWLDVRQQGNVFQHEIDHGAGILISDIGVEVKSA